MPEINMRAGQQPATRRVGPEELAKSEYNLQKFFQKQKSDVIAAEEKRYFKELQENSRKAKILGDAIFRQREKQERDQLAAERRAGQEKQRAEKKAEQDQLRAEANDRKEERQKRNAMYSDALREDRTREREKNRDARDLYANATFENRKLDADKRRVERERVQTERREARAAAAAAPMGFWKGAAIGGGGAGLLGAIIGGAPPTRIMGAAAGSMAGGIGGMLGASASSLGAYGAIAEALVKVLFEPNSIANAITKPYQDYRVAAMDLSRAGLNPGEGAYREFFSGYAGGQSEKLGRVGLGPMDAVQLLSSLGVVPTGNLTDIATTTKAYGMSSAFSAMKGGTVEGVVSQGMGQGNIGANGANLGSYLNNFSRIMEEATSRGMDRSKVLDSMEQSMEIVAKAGSIGVSQDSTMAMVNRFMQSGMTSGRSGEAAASFTGAIEGTMSNITGNALGSAALMSAMPKYGNLKTAKDVQAWVGPQAWAAAGATPEGAQYRQKVVEQITQLANQGRMGAALQASMELMKGDQTRMIALEAPALAQAAGGPNSPLLPFMVQQATGGTYGQSSAFTYNLPNAPGGGRSAMQVAGLTGRGGAAPGNMMAYDTSITDAQYMSRLTAMGLSKDAATALLAGAKQSNTNPFMMAALGNAESHNNPNQGWNQVGTPNLSYGPMQVNLNAHPEMSRLSGAGGYAQGGTVFQQALRASHGNIEAALLSYRGVNDPAWTKKVSEFYQKGMAGGGYAGGTDVSGYDIGIQQSQANEQYQNIQTASMFAPAITAANALAASFGVLQTSVMSLNDTLTKANGGAVIRRPVPFNTGTQHGP